MRRPLPAVATLAIAVVATGATAAGAGTACAARWLAGSASQQQVPSQCSDPCVTAARGESRQCASSVSGAFADALDGCLQRDHGCVDACREQRQACRDATPLGEALAACDVRRDVDEDACRQAHPPGRRRAVCIDRARAGDLACRKSARRANRRATLACEAVFDDCADACGPGTPPDGAKQCRATARGTATGALAACKRTFQASMTACLDKDLQCGVDCIDARAACTAPTEATLQAALAACTAAQATALQVCAATYPAGSAALQTCIQSAQAEAYGCRDAAVQASRPGLEDCVTPYVQCVAACPAA